MPDITNIQIPTPANWQDFERLCADLWEQIWDDPNIQLNGRSGQTQAGVDIWGKAKGSTTILAIQCKGKNVGYGKKLRSKELESEVELAKHFTPKITHLIVATTAASDARIQQTAREISAKHMASGLFAVEVLGWEEISRRIANFPNVFAKHFPQFSPIASGELIVDVSCLVESTPDALRRKVREPWLQSFIYRGVRDGGLVNIRADVPYRDAVAAGGPINGLAFSIAPLVGQFPNLDIKIVNNRLETIFLSEVTLRVRKSVSIEEVLPLFQEPAFSMELCLMNDGWGELKDVWFEYDIGSLEADPRWDRPFPFRVDIGDFEESTTIDLREGFSKIGVDVDLLRKKWRSFGPDKVTFNDGIEVARLDYDDSQKKAMGKYFVKMYQGVMPVAALGSARVTGCLHFRNTNNSAETHSCLIDTIVQLNGALPKAPAPPSFQYDAQVQNCGSNYSVTVPISHSVKAGEVDRFCVRIYCPTSSFHEFDLDIRSTSGAVYCGQRINLEMFVPRRLARIAAASMKSRFDAPVFPI